jgi:hypothetical protein
VKIAFNINNVLAVRSGRINMSSRRFLYGLFRGGNQIYVYSDFGIEFTKVKIEEFKLHNYVFPISIPNKEIDIAFDSTYETGAKITVKYV